MVQPISKQAAVHLITTAVPRILGAVLVTAAAVKWPHVTNAPRDLWLEMLQVAFEAYLGLWFLLGAFQRQSRWVGIFTFAAFAVFSATAGFAGRNDCGCFGAIDVNPWLVFAFDVASLAGLFIWRPLAVSRLTWCDMIVVVLAAPVVFLPFIAPATSRAVISRATLAAVSLGLAPPHAAIIDPEAWLGRPCPILDAMDCPANLRVGRWFIVLYHDDCARCRRFLEALDDAVNRGSQHHQPGGLRIARVELPPYADRRLGCAPPEAVVDGRLLDARAWHAPVPFTLALREGVVTDVIYPDRDAIGRIVAASQ